MKNKLSKSMMMGLVLSIVSISIQADTFWLTGFITRTQAHSTDNGSCMVRITTPIPVETGCRPNWISLDCNGSFSGGGERLFTSALMALALDKRVSILVDDSKKRFYCVGVRLDVLQN